MVTPEKILNSTSFGTADVTMASTKAIERTAPVFCSIVRAPAAIPRRWTGTVPIMAAVFGLLNMPEPTPTTNSHSAAHQRELSIPSIVIPARPSALTSIPSEDSTRDPWRSAQTPASGDEISMPIASGASSIPALIGSSPFTPWK